MPCNRRYLRCLARRLHRDEGATVTVEWMMVFTVALTVLVAIWYLARWAMQSTEKQVEEITKDKKKN